MNSEGDELYGDIAALTFKWVDSSFGWNITRIREILVNTVWENLESLPALAPPQDASLGAAVDMLFWRQAWESYGFYKPLTILIDFVKSLFLRYVSLHLLPKIRHFGPNETK